jgi:bleomycin hydrolase
MGAENSKPSVSETYDEKRAITYVTESMATLHLSDEEVYARYAGVSGDDLRKYAKSFAQDAKNRLAMNAVLSNDPTQVLVNPKAALTDSHIFNVKLELEGAATNQKSSGRCWIFAGKVVYI